MSWMPETNIKGPKGDKGDQGIQGPPGASGTGTGNVVGPASAVADRIATYNGTSGTVIKDGGKLISDLALASHTHTASQVTDFAEAVDDRVGALLVAGSNITLNYDDIANSLTINGSAGGGGGAASGITFTPVGNVSATDVQAAIAEVDSEKAPLASPVLTGDPQAPTPATADNDTSIATTAFVKAQGYAASASVPAPATAIPLTGAVGAVGTSVKYAREDHVHPGTMATWETATAAAVTLSGGNLAATNTGTSSNNQGAHVAFSPGKTTGKHYFEATYTAIVNGVNQGIGIGTTAATFGGLGDQGLNGGISLAAGNTWANNVNTFLGLGARATGDVIGVAVDLDNRKLWFRVAPSGNWNNAAIGSQNPATNTGGIPIPAGTIVPFCTFGGGFGVPNNVTTANFGATAFSGAVPSGFTAGWTDSLPGAVRYDTAQGLTSPQQAQARSNIGAPSAVGVTDGSNAAAGTIGEYVEGIRALASSINVVSATPINITSISLTAGDWDVEGNVQQNNVGGPTTTAMHAWVSSVSAALPAGLGTEGGYVQWRGSTTGNIGTCTGNRRFNLTATTTVYLSCQETFTGGSSVASYGMLRARRVR